jgi:drug/metabolite transporter (DMT)-like permease
MHASTRTTAAAAAALLGFAANSLLCRAALGPRTIDAWSFTAVRLVSGAIVLFVLVQATSSARSERSEGNWTSAAALFTYAAAFSLAYLRLSTGVGALVLFASVQLTMIGFGLYRGERPSGGEWTGLAIALSGLAVLTWPGTAASDPPDSIGLCLMALAGAAWGMYSLRGRGSRAPLLATAANFARCVPMALAGLALACASNRASTHASGRGVVLAMSSGVLASGLGYSLWYLALPGLSATRAALIQLTVPVLAAFAGVLVLGESIRPRLAIAGAMILGGVAIALRFRRRRA